MKYPVKTIVAVTLGVLCMLVLYAGNANALTDAEKAEKNCIAACKQATCLTLLGHDRAMCNHLCAASCSGADVQGICLDPIVVDPNIEAAAGEAETREGGYNSVRVGAGIKEEGYWGIFLTVLSDDIGQLLASFNFTQDPLFSVPIVSAEMPVDVDGCPINDENSEIVLLDSDGVSYDPALRETYADGVPEAVKQAVFDLTGVDLEPLNSNACPPELRCDFNVTKEFSVCSWYPGTGSLWYPEFDLDTCYEKQAAGYTILWSGSLQNRCWALADGSEIPYCEGCVYDPTVYDETIDYGYDSCDGDYYELNLDAITIHEANCPSEKVKLVSEARQEYIAKVGAALGNAVAAQSKALADDGHIISGLTGMPFSFQQLVTCAADAGIDQIQTD